MCSRLCFRIFLCEMNNLLAEITLLSMCLVVQSSGRNSEIAEVLHRPIRSLGFPDGSNTAMFFALAIPLEQPYQSISLAYFFEADYTLPTNFTYHEPWLEPVRRRSVSTKTTKRNIDRALLYQIVESKLEGAGFNGHECLLRTICETSEFSVRHNGLIGDIFHILFTPTSSRHEELPQDILRAERVGRNGCCTVYRAHCPVGLFDLIAVPE